MEHPQSQMFAVGSDSANDASLVREPTEEDLDQAIGRIHRECGLVYPGDYAAIEQGDKIQQLKDRAIRQKSVRAKTVDLLREKYQDQPEIAETAEIMSMIAPYLDNIFVAQMAEHNPGGKPIEPINPPAKSWMQYDEASASALAQTIDYLLSDPEKEKFFAENDHLKTTLACIKELIAENDTDKLAEISDNLQKIAIASFEKGKPIIWLSLSNSWTHPEEEQDKKPAIVNPDGQLVIPIAASKQTIYTNYARSIWDRLCTNYPRAIEAMKSPIEHIGIMAGNSVMWCGGEIASYAKGESLIDGYVFIAENILKTEVMSKARKIFSMINGAVIPDNILEYFQLMYIFHELSHKPFEVETVFEEISAEIPTYLLMLREIRNKSGFLGHLDLVNFLRSIAAENADQALHNSDEYVSYRLSGKYILRELLRAKIITKEGVSWQIHTDEERLDQFIRTLGMFHEQVIGLSDRKPQAQTRKFEEELAEDGDVLSFLADYSQIS